MDFFHLSIGHVSRSTGRSVVQNVAYNTGKVLVEDRRELRADYANNRGSFWETMAPEGSGIAAEDLSFWNKLENFEDDYARQRFKNPASLERYLMSARVGQTYEISLPKELTKNQQIDLIREIVATRFISLGLMATYAIHEDEGNPHTHITVSTRTVWGGEISWEKGVARHLTSQHEFRESRRIFAELINKHQELAGIPDRVDHRSYADRGIELIPTYHKGSQANQMEKDGIFSRIVEENRKIFEANKEKITREPGIILRELTSKQATFSERDVVKLVHKRLGEDGGVLASHVIHSVLRQAVEVGIGFDDLKRYTSVEYKAKEDRILESFQSYQDQKASIKIGGAKVAELLGSDASWLNEGQKAAVKTLCGDQKAAVMVGRAGTGKTTALQYVVALHKQAGYHVLGMAPSATAANELAKGAGLESDTIAHHAHYWRAYHNAVENLAKATTDEDRQRFGKQVEEFEKYLPTQNTLLLIDEAGMVGVGGWNNKIAGGWDAIIKTVNVTGCKLILVGDDYQFKPIDAGDVFRKFVEVLREKGTLCTLDQIQRQTVPWMREASAHLSELRSGVALEMYERQGHMQAYDTDEQVYQEMARQYLRNMVREPDSENIVLAYTNGEVRGLNGAIRKVLKENGLLAAEDILQRPHWTRPPSFDNEGAEPGSQAMEIGTADEVEARCPGTVATEGKTDDGMDDGKATESLEALPPGAERKVSAERIGTGQGFEAFETPETAAENLQAEKWKDGYTIGDRIVFTQNDRGFFTKFQSRDRSFFVRNGTQGIIQSIKPCRIRDRETGEIHKTHQIIATAGADTTVSFYLKEYPHFQHGYAITSHKSQGATADGALVKASPHMDAHAFYVALTRHRFNVGIYYSQADFPDFANLVKEAGKISVKDLAVDYTLSEDRESFWTNVQDYKALGYELHAIRTFAKGADKTNKTEQKKIWREYEKVKAERKDLAKFILNDWEDHKDFVRQAGLTHETLEIAAGLRKRPLSRLEVEAQQTVEQYASVAIEAWETWRTIRKSHPGTRAKTHPDWNTFEALREQRGVLANQIIQNPELYRPLLREAALAWEDGTDKLGKNHFGYGISIVKAQAEAHQSKMLQREILRNASDPVVGERLQTLLNYVETRDLAASAWQDLRPRLKEFEGTLLSTSFCKEVDEFTDMRKTRDSQAAKIVDDWEDYSNLTQKAGLKLDFDKLFEQKEQSVRDRLFMTYTTSQEEMNKLKAAFEIKALMDDEFSGKRITVRQVYNQGLNPEDVSRDALEYQKLKVFETLSTDGERQLFVLLDEYDDKCRAANQVYALCAQDMKERNEANKTSLKPWDSAHYPSYKAACDARNEIALEIFDLRVHENVLKLADAMGMKFKEVELQEIFARCEQANRTRHIQGYLGAEGAETKGQAAIDLLKLIDAEKRESGARDQEGKRLIPESITARQSYFAGINLKTLQAEAFKYQRATTLSTFNPEGVKVFHALQEYETASQKGKERYVTCLAEGKEKSVKPWETETFKEYLSTVTRQDQIAYDFLKSTDNKVLAAVATSMAISLKGLDVEAHRHDLRGTLQSFTEGDRTNVPMAAYELLHWLAFDRHSDFKHTFKVLREKDLWPRDIQDSLQAFHAKKREYKRKEHAERPTHQDKPQPEYHVETYEKFRSHQEIEEALKGRIQELAEQLLGNPTSRRGNQWRFGRKGSVSVAVSGEKQGLYSNFETGVHGGAFKMIEDQVGLSSFKDTIKWASDWLGDNPMVVERRVIEKQPNDKKSTWTPIVPVPHDVAAPDIAGNKYLNWMLKDGGKEASRHAYRDEHGNLKGYVFRIETPNPKNPDGKPDKITPPLAWCENERGFRCWKWQGFFNKEDKTPYGLEKLARDLAKPVLVVEGEKKADAAQKILPDYHVLSWIGGAGSVDKTDWKPLLERQIVFWPDNDAAGFKAAEAFQQVMKKLAADQAKYASGDPKPTVVGVVNLPSGLEKGWDLADKLPEGWTVETVRQMIRDAAPQLQKSTEMEENSHESNHEHQQQKPDLDRQKFAEEAKLILSEIKPYVLPDELDKLQAIFNAAADPSIKDGTNPVTAEALREAKLILTQIAPYLAPEVMDRLRETFATATQQDGNDDAKARSIDPQAVVAATQEYLSLSEQYENSKLPWKERNQIAERLNSLADGNLHAKAFSDAVQNSGNHEAIKRLDVARHMYEINRDWSKGRGMEI